MSPNCIKAAVLILALLPPAQAGDARVSAGRPAAADPKVKKLARLTAELMGRMKHEMLEPRFLARRSDWKDELDRAGAVGALGGLMAEFAEGVSTAAAGTGVVPGTFKAYSRHGDIRPLPAAFRAAQDLGGLARGLLTLEGALDGYCYGDPPDEWAGKWRKAVRAWAPPLKAGGEGAECGTGAEEGFRVMDSANLFLELARGVRSYYGPRDGAGREAWITRAHGARSLRELGAVAADFAAELKPGEMARGWPAEKETWAAGMKAASAPKEFGERLIKLERLIADKAKTGTFREERRDWAARVRETFKKE